MYAISFSIEMVGLVIALHSLNQSMKGVLIGSATFFAGLLVWILLDLIQVS